MSSVSDLRRITTQERLRSDHIAMMEMLQVSVTENEALKAEVAKLKQQLSKVEVGIRLSSEGEDPSTTASSSAGASESMAALVQRVLVQDSTIKELKEEVKVLTSKLASSSLEIRTLKKSSSTNESLRRDLDNMLAAQKMRDIEVAGAAAELGDLRARVADRDALEMTVSKLTAENNLLSGGISDCERSLRDRISELENQADTLSQELLSSQADITTKAVRISTLELTLREMTRVKGDMEQVWRDKFHSESLESERMRARASVSEAREAELLKSLAAAKMELDTFAAGAAATAAAAAAIAAPSASLQGIKPNPLIDNSSSTAFLTGASELPEPSPMQGAGANGGLFEEFIRLKRENKQLKLELLGRGGGAQNVAEQDSLINSSSTGSLANAPTPLKAPQIHQGRQGQRQPGLKRR